MTIPAASQFSDKCYFCQDDWIVTEKIAGKWVSNNRNVFVPECGHGVHNGCFNDFRKTAYQTRADLVCGLCRRNLIHEIPASMNDSELRDSRRLFTFLTIQVLGNLVYWQYSGGNLHPMNMFAAAAIIYNLSLLIAFTR